MSEVRPVIYKDNHHTTQQWRSLDMLVLLRLTLIDHPFGTNIPVQINPDDILKQLREDPESSLKENIHTENAVASVTPYSTRYSSKEAIPKFRIPQEGAPGEVAAQLLRDELDLDGRPSLNLARYVVQYQG